MLNIFKKNQSANNLLKKVVKTKPIVLTITFQNGNVFLNGPISDKLMCYGLLAVAHDIIKDYKLTEKEPEKKVLPIEGLSKVN